MDKTRDEKRAGLIDVAFTVLRKQGFKKTTLDDIAAAAGMATTSIYYYFRNKQELLRSVTQMLVARTLERMEAAVAAASTPEEKLVATWRVLFAAVTNSGFLVNPKGAPKSAMLAAIDDLLGDFENRYQEAIRKIIVEGVARKVFQVDDIDLTVAVLSNGAIGLLTTVAGEDEYEIIESRIEKVGSLLMNGLRRR